MSTKGIAGLLADGRKYHKLAREEGSKIRKMWREPLTVKVIT